MSQKGKKRIEEKGEKRMAEYFTALFFIIKTSG
jgi:hypothetical protein